MSDMYPFYFLLGALLCFGAKSASRGMKSLLRTAEDLHHRSLGIEGDVQQGGQPYPIEK